MGPCQGQKCMLRVAAILSRELGVPYEDIVKEGAKNKLFVGKVKEL